MNKVILKREMEGEQVKKSTNCHLLRNAFMTGNSIALATDYNRLFNLSRAFAFFRILLLMATVVIVFYHFSIKTAPIMHLNSKERISHFYIWVKFQSNLCVTFRLIILLQIKVLEIAFDFNSSNR